MKYKMIERANPQDKTKKKWYAAPVNDGNVTQTEVSQDIVLLSSLGRGDVMNVIGSMIDTIPKYLLMGKSVKLGELGTFRISFSSEGVEDPAEFNVNKISGLRIVFTPSPVLRKSLDAIHFEKSPGH